MRTVNVVDLQPGQVFGSSVLGSRQECRIVDGKISVVVFQDGERRPLDAVEVGDSEGRRK